jgi:outer membrane protein
MSNHLRLLTPLVFLATLAPIAGFGADLSQAYIDSVDNDPVLGAAREGYDASREVVPQSRSQLLPNVFVAAQGSENKRDQPGSRTVDTDPGSPSFGELVPVGSTNFREHGWQAQLIQPLFDAEAWFTYKGSLARREQAASDFEATEDELIVRVAAAYLDVLRAQALLESTQAEEAAVKRQLEQIQQRFDVGLVAITDVLESTAAFDLAQVRRIQAEGDHDIFFETLATLTGVKYQELARLSEELPVINPEPVDVEQWVATALEENPLVDSAKQQLAAAEQELKARISGHLPTIDAEVTYNSFTTHGNAFFGDKTELSTYGLRLQMPIYQGGFTSSRVREARSRSMEAREFLRGRELVVERDTRNLLMRVVTDVQRVRARLRAIRSSESALEAIETGYEVGTRNIVDVLDAQRVLFGSQFDYADSRYNYVLNLLLLKQTAGTLAEQDIDDLNAFSDMSNPVERLTTLSRYQGGAPTSVN